MHEKAESVGLQIASLRSHQPMRLEAKPTVLNLMLWRLVYEHEGRFYVDAVHLWPWKVNQVYEGASVEKLSAPPSQWPVGSVAARDFERFRWFSNDYLIRHPMLEGIVGDVRYAMLPHRIEPLWGIRADLARPQAPVEFVTSRSFSAEARASFWRMLRGEPD